MYPRRFLVEVGEKAIWESQFTFFFLVHFIAENKYEIFDNIFFAPKLCIFRKKTFVDKS